MVLNLGEDTVLVQDLEFDPGINTTLNHLAVKAYEQYCKYDQNPFGELVEREVFCYAFIQGFMTHIQGGHRNTRLE